MSEPYRKTGAEGRENPDTQRAAAQYLRAGLAVIPVPTGEKNPNRPGWQNERLTIEDVPRRWTNGQGVGVLWGVPSGGLVDVDMDWAEARTAAPHILPATRTFGRPSAPESHRIYRTVGTIPKTQRYKVGGDGDDRSVVEVLSTGTQSLAPPSLHDSGERREWHQGHPAAEVDGKALMEGVADVATAALIARKWPGKGARHDYAMAATGYVGRNLSRSRAKRVMEAAIYASDDEETAARLRDVRDTLDNLATETAVTGGPTLDALAPGIVDQLRRWHRWGGERTPQPDRGAPSFNLTDLGNAERFAAQHGENVRYVHPWGKWLVYVEGRWKVDDTGEVVSLMKKTVRDIYREAADAQGEDSRKALAVHAKRSESKARIADALHLARTEPGIPTAPDQLDADPWVLNVLNGTIDLRTGELRDHRRADLITKIAPVEYDPHADAPRFATFLREVFDGDDGLVQFVQRFAGYSLTGSTVERAFAILHGSGKNGKTTLVELLHDVLGDYARNTDTETVLRKRNAGVGNDVAALKGARVVSAAEVEQGRALAESKVKNLTGSDTVTARFLFAEPFDFRPEFKLWLSTNNKPVIHGTDDAIWDRIRLIPFTRRFAGTQADHALPRKLRAELPGVLAWMVQGCLDWQREGLGVSDKVVTATEGYRAEMDALAGFVDECCIVKPDVWCKFADLYFAYTRWCEESNEYPQKKRRFADSLTERGFKPDNGAKNVAIRRGIALRYDGAPDPSRVNDRATNPVPERPSPRPEKGTNVNRVNERLEDINPQNTCKHKDSGGRVNEGYRKSTSFGPENSRKEESRKRLTLVNSLTPEAENPPHGTPREGRLTSEQAERVNRLIGEGMAHHWALSEVLGYEAGQ